MGARALLNLGLAALVLALGLVLWLDPGSEDAGDAARLTGLAADDVAQVVIRQGRDDEIRIERVAGQWRLTAPIQAPANEFRIEPLLRIVDATSHTRFAADDPASYGLDPPRAELRLDGVEIAFGDTEPLDHRRYLRIGDTIHLVEDHYLHRLQAGYPAFVSNRLLPEGARPVRLELPDFAIAQDAQGRWTIDPELGIAMDALNRIVDAWVEARAILVGRYDGATAQGTIRVTLQGEERAREFLILESEVDLVLALPESGIVYHLGSEQGGRMMKPDSEAPGEPAP